MKLNSRVQISYLVTLAAGVAIGVAVVNGAVAAPAAPAAAAKTITHHYALAASAFAPDSLGDTTLDYFNRWNPTALFNHSAGRCFNAGLSLPAGSTIKSVKFYFTEGSVGMSFEVNRQNLVNHTFVRLARGNTPVTTSMTYTSITRRVPASKAFVDYGKYAYSAGACPGGTGSFSGLIITYTQPA